MAGDWGDTGKRQELTTRAETTINLIDQVEDLKCRIEKAIEGYHWIAEKNRFVDTGSKNKATVMLSILENKEKESK